MPGASLNPYGCEWSIGYLWRWINWIGRTDVFLLALLLAYIVAVFARVSSCCRLARRARGIDTDNRSRRKLAADLRIQLSNLKSIASTAPYLGLVGTCFGILSIFRGFVMEKHAVQIMMTSTIAAALVTTAAGILVAIPATCFYNYLSPRIDMLESELSNEDVEPSSRHFQVARRFPLTKRFSTFPAFALIAAPSLAILVIGYMTFASFRPPKGLGIELGSTHCGDDGDERLIVLHITDAGKLLLSSEEVDRNSLAGRLSEIYKMREDRTLYLFADDSVPFQTVADAIDIVQNAGVTVRFITPTAMKARCPEPVVTGFSQHASQ